MTGSSVAQAIALAFVPILTRLYTPEDFGLLAIYVSLASFLSLAATARYEMAILLATEQQESDDLTLISIVIAIAVALVAFFIVFIFNEPISQLVANKEISLWLYFIPISVLATGIYQSFNYWLTRKKLYRELSKGRVINSVVNVSVSTSLGFNLPATNGLIVGNIFSPVAMAVFYWRKTYLQGFYPNINATKASVYLKKYYRFPLFQLPNVLIDGIRQSVLNIMIGRFFGMDLLGFYSLALKLLMLPTTLVGGAISQVFYQKLSEMHNNDEMTFRFIITFVTKAMLLSLPFYMLLYYFSVDLFSFILGEKWKVSGEIVQELIPWFYLTFVSSTISTVFIVFAKQAYLLILSIIYLIVPVVMVLYNSEDIFNALKMMSYGMSCVLLVMIALALRVSYCESKRY